jgi:hypothetical protein
VNVRTVNKNEQKRLAMLASQGQRWSFKSTNPVFEPQVPFALDPPLEVTINMLRGLRMVDETVVVCDLESNAILTKVDQEDRV